MANCVLARMWRMMVSILSLPRIVHGARLAGSAMRKYGRTAVRPYGQKPETRNPPAKGGSAFGGKPERTGERPFAPTLTHSCLANSVLNVHELEKTGVKNRLAIGVKKENGKLLAHAWVEKEGEDFDEQEGFKKLGTL